MRKLFALFFLTIACLAHADSMIDTADFKLDLVGEWVPGKSTDPDQHSFYSKQQDVGITASSMRFKKGLSDLRRIADKLVEMRMAAENAEGKRSDIQMTIAEPVVVPFAQGYQVAYYGHDSRNRQFRYLGVVTDGRIVNLYVESNGKSQQELEGTFNTILKGLVL